MEEKFELRAEPRSAERSVVLRPYQLESNRLVDAHLEQHSRCHVVMATGLGKTECFIENARKYQDKGVLIIEPLISLVGQTAARLRARGIQCGVEQGGLRSDEKVTVACYQSLLSRKRWERYLGCVGLIIIDECHVNFSKRSLEMLTNLAQGGAKLVAYTATPDRDGDPIASFYGDRVFDYDILSATRDGYLVPAKVWLSVINSLDLSRFKTQRFSDYNAEELARVLAQEQTVQEIGLWIYDHHEGQSSLAFCHGIQQAEAVRDNLKRRGLESAIVHSQMEDLERRQHLDDFETGRVNLIINVGVLTLGYDFPPIRKLFLAKPTKSRGKYAQMYGRGPRVLSGVIDGKHTVEARKLAIAASSKPFFELFDLTDSSRHCDLITALDVLQPETDRKLMARTKKRLGAAAGGVLDIDALVAEEAKAEAQEQQARDRLEWSRRGQLLIQNGDISNYELSADRFAEQPAPKKRGWYMLFGPFKGTHLSEVPTGHLQWVAHRAKYNNEAFRQACRSELARR